MRRAIAAMTAALIVIASAGAASASSEAPIETSARASILAAVLDAQPAFDPALVDSRSARSNIGRSSLNSVVWPSFLVDAFFFLYGFQSVERIGLGISEARSPQGPMAERATLSDLAFANGGDAAAIPGKAGRSESNAGDTSAHGSSSIADAALPGGAHAAKAVSSSRVAPIDGGTEAAAEQVVSRLTVGPISVQHIRGRALVRHTDTAAAAASLAITDATVAGIPVLLDEEGARAATAPLQEQVDAALRDSGMAVRILPSEEREDGDDGEASSGGLLVETRFAADDPTGTPRDVKVGYVFGSAKAGVSVGVAQDAPVAAPRIDVPSFPAFGGAPSVTVPLGGSAQNAPGSQDPLVRRRLVVTNAAAGASATARGAYGALMLIGLSLLFLRPLVRAGARP